MSKVQKLIHVMKDCGETLTDKMIIEKIMRMLTSHFDHVIVVTQKSNNLETLKLEDWLVRWRQVRLGLSKGKQFKNRYKHYNLSHGRRMVVPTSSKVKSTRLRTISLGRNLTRIRSMMEEGVVWMLWKYYFDQCCMV